MELPAVLASNLEQVRLQIRQAAGRCGRDPASVQLLAVSKQQGADRIAAVAACGQLDFGENYLQEALEKMSVVRAPVVWHFIGQIQSNKTRAVAERFAWVHTVDRLKIAQRLSEQRPESAPPLNVCMQIKLAEETGKGGSSLEEAPALARAICILPRLKLRGLMCIPPPSERFEEQFAYFKRCADLLRSMNESGLPTQLDTLSMGMSADLDAAIAAGATIVRVGTGIFGARAK